MKIPAIAACMIVLAGCSGAVVKPQATVASAGTYSCWQDRLVDQGGDLECNWEASYAAACESHATVTLSKTALTGSPQRTRRCDNGQWLVTVTSR